nr:MAG TPA: hypothetical protein [Caudoviricetes sp.]
MEHPCESCTKGRGENCMCNRWREWFLSEVERTDESAQETATSFDVQELPKRDRPTTHREIVFSSIFTRLWR